MRPRPRRHPRGPARVPPTHPQPAALRDTGAATRALVAKIQAWSRAWCTPSSSGADRLVHPVRGRPAARADLTAMTGEDARVPKTTVRDSDESVVARLLGREPGGAFTVVVRTLDGTPAVIENAPLLRDGRPMPTRFWLVDPEL